MSETVAANFLYPKYIPQLEHKAEKSQLSMEAGPYLRILEYRTGVNENIRLLVSVGLDTTDFTGFGLDIDNARWVDGALRCIVFQVCIVYLCVYLCARIWWFVQNNINKVSY